MKVGFVGMSHLGLNSLAAAAHRGAKVIGFDLSSDTIDALKKGQVEINEPRLNELLEQHQDTICFTDEMTELSGCDMVYIALDVATDDMGNSNLEPLENLIQLADESLPSDTLLIVLSQIPPGFSRCLTLNSQRPYLYQVETLIFGDAINRALNPERFIVGMPNPQSTLPACYTDYLALYDCPVLPMRFESAELCKISINCCLVASVSIANTLAELCEKVGADWDEIIPALKSDRRIGQYSYLSPGLGFAGGNLERDLNTVMQLSSVNQTDASVVSAYISNSQYRKNWPLQTIKKIYKDLSGLRVAIWGLSYKINTHSLKNSPAIHFIETAAKESNFQIKLSSFDPVVQQAQVASLPGSVAESPLTACESADVLIVMTPWSQFSEIAAEHIASRMTGKLILDPYKALSQAACESVGLHYLTLGKSS